VAGENFAKGRGYTIELKGYVPSDVSIGGPGTLLFPMGYSLVAGFFFAQTGNIHSVQVLNVFFAAANVAVIYRITLLMARRAIALLAGILVAWLPLMAHHSYQVMSEQLSLLLTLLTLWCVVARPSSRWGWLLSGIGSGLAYTVRTANVALLPVLFIASMMNKERAIRDRTLEAMCILAGWIIGAGPVLLIQSVEPSGILPPYFVWLRALDFQDLLRLAQPAPWAATPFQLLSEQFPAVVQRILSNGGRYLTFLISSHGLSVVALGLPLAVAGLLTQKEFGMRALGVTATFYFMVASAYWFVFLERYLLVPIVLLLPLCLTALDACWVSASQVLGRRTSLVALGLAAVILAHPRIMLVARLNVEAVQVFVNGSARVSISDEEWLSTANWLKRHAPPKALLQFLSPIWTNFTGTRGFRQLSCPRLRPANNFLTFCMKIMRLMFSSLNHRRILLAQNGGCMPKVLLRRPMARCSSRAGSGCMPCHESAAQERAMQNAVCSTGT
jgi:hypothetical protein